MSIDATSLLSINASATLLKPSYITLVNNNEINVSGRFRGRGTVGGNGLMTISPGGHGGDLDVLSEDSDGSLTVVGDLELQAGSTTSLKINPTQRLAHHISIGGDFTIGLAPASLADLDLLVVDDAVLPYGTKFMLFDYSDANGMTGFFEGLSDGTVFQLGLNHYQIAYNDPGWSGSNASVITITAVVPEPSTLGIACLGAAGIFGGYVRRRVSTKRRCM